MAQCNTESVGFVRLDVEDMSKVGWRRTKRVAETPDACEILPLFRIPLAAGARSRMSKLTRYIAVHGGAGDHSPEHDQVVRRAMRR